MRCPALTFIPNVLFFCNNRYYSTLATGAPWRRGETPGASGTEMISTKQVFSTCETIGIPERHVYRFNSVPEPGSDMSVSHSYSPRIRKLLIGKDQMF